MENTDIINLWKVYDKKLENSLTLNKTMAQDITNIKIQSLLTSMKPLKIFTLIVGVLWVILVDSLIINLFYVANPIFLISAAIQVILTKIAIGIYVYHLVLIKKIDINEPILATQSHLSQLKSSTLLVARILFLQLPVWTTFYWNESMLQNGNLVLYVFQAIVTLTFIGLAIWLFVNIKYENKDKKWFKLIFNGKEWNPILKAIELQKEIDRFNG